MVKLGLDVKYFETCLDLSLCPEFLKFKIPSLNCDKNGKYLYLTVVRKKHKKVNREKRIAEARFRTPRDEILNNPSFSEKTCPISLLNQEFKRFAHPRILTHKKKLFNLWKNQAVYCPNCIVNLSKKKLSLHITNPLMFG